MSLEYVTKYGAPDYGPRKGTVAIVLHTTEGATGKAGALSTATWQANPAQNPSGGSYHYILGVDGDVVTAVKTVYREHIAGSISRRRDSVWIADTDRELLAYMGAAAVADPNSFVIAISIAGRTAYYDANGWPPALVNGLAMLIRHLEVAYNIPDIFVTNHYRFQSNRSDAGRKLTPLVMSEYQRLYAPKPAPATEQPNWSGKLTAFGTRFPQYIHTDADALAWYARTVRNLIEAGKINGF